MLPNRLIVAAANSLPERASGKPKTCAPVHRLVRQISLPTGLPRGNAILLIYITKL